jgi:predicted ATPase with chaperone activity
MQSRHLKQRCPLDERVRRNPAGEGPWAGCSDPPRAAHRILKVARTIADLGMTKDRLQTQHLAEAAQYLDP